jgi:hypothetical protein
LVQRITVHGAELRMIARQLSECGQGIRGTSAVDLGCCDDDALVGATSRFGQLGEDSCRLGHGDLTDGAQRVIESIVDMARVERENLALLDGLLRLAALVGAGACGLVR